MKKERVYHVSAESKGRWKIIADDAPPLFVTTEREALAKAREWAAVADGQSHIVIHRPDGSVEEEHSYGMESFLHPRPPIQEKPRAHGVEQEPLRGRQSPGAQERAQL
jgi:hypothetical protein